MTDSGMLHVCHTDGAVPGCLVEPEISEECGEFEEQLQVAVVVPAAVRQLLQRRRVGRLRLPELTQLLPVLDQVELAVLALHQTSEHLKVTDDDLELIQLT